MTLGIGSFLTRVPLSESHASPSSPNSNLLYSDPFFIDMRNRPTLDLAASRWQAGDYAQCREQAVRRFSLRCSSIARLTVLVFLLHLPYASFGQKLEENTARHGADFRDFDLPSPDPLLCRKACVEDNLCRSFTYLKPNNVPGSPQVAHCWLKAGIPAAKRDPAFVSGVVPEKTLPPGKPGDWLVETSSFSVMDGPSSDLITSDGHFRRSYRGKSQEGSVPPGALRKLRETILAAKLSTWKASYNGACSDCPRQTLRLELCGGDGKWVRYFGTMESLPVPPADIEAVLAAMNF